MAGETGSYEASENPRNRISFKNRIQVWYVNPLIKMKGDDCFICMAMCFIILEKYLRKKCQMKDSEKFTDGHPCFSKLGSLLKISSREACHFWQSFRNGILHRAMPKVSTEYSFLLVSNQDKPVTVSQGKMIINPWKIRDIVVGILDNKINQDIWKEEDYPLMYDYRSEK
jgi:hypothetical protein